MIPISTPHDGRRWWDSNLRTSTCESPALPLCCMRQPLMFTRQPLAVGLFAHVHPITQTFQQLWSLIKKKKKKNLSRLYFLIDHCPLMSTFIWEARLQSKHL